MAIRRTNNKLRKRPSMKNRNTCSGRSIIHWQGRMQNRCYLHHHIISLSKWWNMRKNWVKIESRDGDTYRLTKLDKRLIWSLIYPFKPWVLRSLKPKQALRLTATWIGRVNKLKKSGKKSYITSHLWREQFYR